MNSDGLIDLADRDTWLSESGPFTVGDTDLDGRVNSEDLNSLGVNWQSAGASWSQGDFDGNGFVDSRDLNGLGLNWQFGSQAAAVPEPATNLLFAMCFVALAIGRKRSIV